MTESLHLYYLNNLATQTRTEQCQHPLAWQYEWGESQRPTHTEDLQAYNVKREKSCASQR